MEAEAMWQKLVEYDQANCIMDAFCPRGTRSDGIVPFHSYSVLRCVQVGEFKMICMRNSWGGFGTADGQMEVRNGKNIRKWLQPWSRRRTTMAFSGWNSQTGSPFGMRFV